MRRILSYILRLYIIVSLCVACGRSEKEKKQTKKIGDYNVEAFFKNDSVMDGVARYFGKNGSLVKVVNYINGIKNGFEVNYYNNGNKSDSLNFINGIKNGYQYTFDNLGVLSSISYQYYGLLMGPQIEYKNNNPDKYFYHDFGKEDLIDCEYDNPGGLLSQLKYFTTKPRLAEVIAGGNKMLELFAYLPHPPNVEISFNVGIQNDAKQTKPLFAIDNNRVLFDTLIPYNEKGWYYYLSTNIKNRTGSVYKFYIEEIRHSSDHPPVVGDVPRIKVH